MGLKNDYTNELRKAQKVNNESAAAYWQAQINALTKQRGDAAYARAESKRRKQNSYQVKRGDNWFTIADQIYGDQRMVGLLMEANVGIALLSQGQVLHLPPMPVLDAGGAVFFSQDSFDTALDIESDLKELTTPPDDSAALTAKYDELFTPEDLAFAQEIADLMDEIDAEAFDPNSPAGRAQVTAAQQPTPTSPTAPRTPADPLDFKADDLGFNALPTKATGEQQPQSSAKERARRLRPNNRRRTRESDSERKACKAEE